MILKKILNLIISIIVISIFSIIMYMIYNLSGIFGILISYGFVLLIGAFGCTIKTFIDIFDEEPGEEPDEELH